MNLVFAQPVGCGRDDESTHPRRPALGPVLSYGFGAILGGAVTGGLLASIGARFGDLNVGPVLQVATVVLCVVATVLQVQGRVRALPQRHAQVPRRWTLWGSRSKLGLAFGAMLGSGVFTYLHYAAMYLLAVIALTSQRPAVGALVGAAYGGVRGLVLVYAWLSAPRVEERDRRLNYAARAAAKVLTPFSITVTVIVVALQVGAW